MSMRAELIQSLYGDFKVVHQMVNMSCMQLRKNVLRDVNTRRDEIRFRSFNTVHCTMVVVNSRSFRSN